MISVTSSILAAFSHKSRDANKPEVVMLNSGEKSTVRTGGGLTVSGLVPQSTIDAMAGIDVAKERESLVSQLGDQLGFDANQYLSADDYGKDIVDQLQSLKQTVEGRKQLDSINAKIGLDKIGVSLDTLIGAIKAPGGDEDKRLGAVFRGRSEIERRYQEDVLLYESLHGGGDGTYGPTGKVELGR